MFDHQRCCAAELTARRETLDQASDQHADRRH